MTTQPGDRSKPGGRSVAIHWKRALIATSEEAGAAAHVGSSASVAELKRAAQTAVSAKPADDVKGFSDKKIRIVATPR